MAITFSTIDTPYKFNKRKLVKEWIKICISSYNFSVGDISIAFCSDTYILEINNKFLEHNYFTDIITFQYSSNKIIDADILISIDTVKSNSLIFEQSFNHELNRVIIHGILHLVGFNDLTNEQKQQMRVEEDKWLSQLNIY